MKKIISGLICLAIGAAALVPVSAAESDKMKAALGAVKERIEIPAELSVFRSGIRNERNEEIGYTFHWSNEDGNESIYVSADSLGRINSYSHNLDTKRSAGLAETSKADALQLADSMLKKAAPELFANGGDLLVYEESRTTGRAYNDFCLYDFTYLRRKDGIEVENNSAQISVRAYADTAYVADMNLSWDYDTTFSAEKAALSNPNDSYIAQFPIELVYGRRYGTPVPIVLKNSLEIDSDVVMQYQFKDEPGYISATDGKILSPDSYHDEYYLTEASAGGMKQELAADNAFSVEELAELDRIEGLISEEDAEKLIRSISSLGIGAKMEKTASHIFRYRPWYISENSDADAESFRMRLSLSEDNKHTSVTLDAQTGEIISFSATGDYAEKTTGNAKAAIAKLLDEVCAQKAQECEEATESDNEYYLSGNMRRIVNGIPYEGNGISYGYSKKYSRISSYDLQWDEYTEHFADPNTAIGLDTATDKIFAIAPLKLVYIKVDNRFCLCYALSKSSYYTKLDAASGEPLYKQTETSPISYDDISGHWAESAILRLADVGMFEPSESFRPDESITQAELLRLMANAFLGGNYQDWSEEEFYEMLNRNEYIKDGEKNPNAAVLREDAFVFAVRFMGYDKVAGLRDIFRCSYSDSAEISPEKLGHTAILTGFGIISGDVNSIRGRDNTTRSEAAMIVYKALTSAGVR